MLRFSDRLPDYFRGKFQTLSTVTFTAFFALVFILVVSHYSHTTWFSLSDPDSFTVGVIFYLLSLLSLIISRRVMYVTRNEWNLTYLHYILWCLGEIALISILYVVAVTQGGQRGAIPPTGMSYGYQFYMAFLVTSFALGIPYILCGMYFAIEDKNNTIRLMNFGNVVTDEESPAYSEKKITLFDNSGVLKLSVSVLNLYYIESDDNYIKVWYTDNAGVLKQYMLRCRLKTVEDSFRDSHLVRCHRKYIVNMLHVKVLSREKDAYLLSLDNDSIERIPVSKTYEEHVLELFNSR